MDMNDHYDLQRRGKGVPAPGATGVPVQAGHVPNALQVPRDPFVDRVGEIARQIDPGARPSDGSGNQNRPGRQVRAHTVRKLQRSRLAVRIELGRSGVQPSRPLREAAIALRRLCSKAPLSPHGLGGDLL